MTSDGAQFDKRKFMDLAINILINSVFEYASPIDYDNCTSGDIITRPQQAYAAYKGSPLFRTQINRMVQSLMVAVEMSQESIEPIGEAANG